MPSPSNPAAINRIIDANINRAKEGLRVCEEIARFILNSSVLTSEFKQVRHRLDSALKRLAPRIALIKHRNSLSDVGRDIYAGELKRKDLRDVFFANIQRTKESIRVLEEFSKLKDTGAAIGFKKLRYRVYEIEKSAVKKVASLCSHR